MSEIRVATRYAKSLFDLAEEKNQLDRIEQDALTFLSVCKEDRHFSNMLKSPIIHTDKKLNIIHKLFNDKFDKVTIAFIEIVLRKKREMVLAEIFQQYVEMYKEKKGILTATVYTAVPISDKIREDIVSFLQKETHKQIELKTAVNQDVLGGFVLQYEDKLLDASVASQLKSLRNHLINNN